MTAGTAGFDDDGPAAIPLVARNLRAHAVGVKMTWSDAYKTSGGITTRRAKASLRHVLPPVS